MNQVEALEQAIIERARMMAEECAHRGQAGRKNILRDASDRLHLREEKETLQARSHAERAYLRKVQADELKLRSKMDHMRWNLVQVVTERLPERMRAFTEDEGRYFGFLAALLKQAAEQMEETTLEVRMNESDLHRLKPQWNEFTAELAPGTEFVLANETIDTLGGCLITTADNRVRIDHSFEGRLVRLERKIHQALVERLLPPVGEGQVF